MSNVLKSMSYVTTSTDKRVIDYNELISQKLEIIRQGLSVVSEDGFTPGLNAENVEVLLGEEEMAASVEEQANEMLEMAKLQADKILSMAKGDADHVLRKAADERMEMIKSAHQEGFDKGYQDALQQCQMEYEAKEAELEKRRAELEEDFCRQKDELEPRLVDTILDVFQNITHLLLEDKRDLILEVVNSTFEDIDVSRNYLVRVCHEDAVFLKENKDKIVCLSSDSNVEIVEDPTMKKGQCLIDADFGIVDCSLDMQMEELVKDIKIISCMGRHAE